MRISDCSSDVCSSDLADGREQIVGVVFPSDFIGRPFGKESPYSVTAMTDGEVCIFNRKSFDEFASAHPDLQHKLLRRTLDELDRARHWMMLLGRKSAEEKVASFLLEMRSEEHTSELQSLMRISYAVFCLKNTKKTRNQHN